MTDVKVRVIGSHTSEDGSRELIESKGVGHYHLHKDKHFLIFDELTQDRELIHSRVVYDYGRLSVVRKGAVSSEMEYVQGQTTTMKYAVPAGELEFTIYTKKLTAAIGDGMIEFSAEYEIRNGKEVLQKSGITILAVPDDNR